MRIPAAILTTAVLAMPAFHGAALAATETDDFVVRLGQDTVGVEHVTRSEGRIEVNQVGRSPRVLSRHYTYAFERGSLARLDVVVSAPGADAPVQTIAARVEADSLHLEIHAGSAPPTLASVAIPAGTLVVASASPWSGYQSQTMKLARSGADSLRGTMYFLGAPSTGWFSLHRLGADSVVILTEHADVFHARVDRAGRILGVLPIAGTGKFSVERVAKLDLAGMTASFSAREHASGAMGALSPRDSVRATAGGAALSIDYSRPGKRGRVIFGGVVPYGQVWRTGANAATVFRTDKALDFGGVVVPAGAYTLWTVPAPEGWKLLVNSQTGQWGTEHDPAKDAYTIPLQTSVLGAPQEQFLIRVESTAEGGVLQLDWDTTRASAAFTVKP